MDPDEPTPSETPDADAHDDTVADAPDAVGPRPSSPRPNRVAVAVSGLVIAALALGVGIVIGRATAPSAGGTAAVATETPGGSGSLASAASDAPASPAASGAPSPAPSSFLDGLPSDGPLLGLSSAPVQITYWADYQCPYCAKFANDLLPQLASRIKDGTVAVLHRDYAFLGQESLDAGIAVRCAGEQGRYWPMHDAVYAAQAGENEGAFATDKLKAIAASAGLDATAFAACLDRHDVLVALLADTAAATRSGVTSTPTIDVPGQRFKGVPDTASILKAIDAAAAPGAQPTAAPSFTPTAGSWAGTPTDGRTAGRSTARVTVELWVDYQADGMPALVKGLEPELRKRVDAGKVRLILRDLATLGDESVAGASFVRCSTESGASGWLASDVLGASAQGANAGVFTPRNLLWFGARIGDDVQAIDTCLADPATAAAVKAETAVGAGLGLSSAPAVLVKVGSRETARFTGTLDVAKVLAAVDAAK